MLLPQILLLAGVSAAARVGLRSVPSGEPRRWTILALSVICLYWLQPNLPVRYLDFWLPTATLVLAALGWVLTAAPEARRARENGITALVMVGLVLLHGLARSTAAGAWLDLRPPAFAQVALAVLLIGLALGGLALALRGKHAPSGLLWLAIVFLVALLVVLKEPGLSRLSAAGLRGWMGQNPALAAALDIRWLGFSYLCFRLIHTLRDRQTGRLPEAGLRGYVSYLIFFPALVAGPIDRLERFLPDYRADLAAQEAARFEADWIQAARRLALGLFKKFALADTLALVALAPQNALQAQGAGWLWLMLYAYALLIYLDFSGYTDIAIGMGRLWGVRLPENFAAPYLRPNLTQFWNGWHMTLTQWFRAYYFNPLVRWLRGPRVQASPAVVLFLTQVTTMLLIGLWHGVTWGFVVWGLWHGLGLFFQNRWSEYARGRFTGVSEAGQRALRVLSMLLTFHYVALGWVWFTIPDPRAALSVLARLFGGEVLP